MCPRNIGPGALDETLIANEKTSFEVVGEQGRTRRKIAQQSARFVVGGVRLAQPWVVRWGWKARERKSEKDQRQDGAQLPHAENGCPDDDGNPRKCGNEGDGGSKIASNVGVAWVESAHQRCGHRPRRTHEQRCPDHA